MNKTCDTCGGSQKIVVGCAFDSPIIMPCPACSKMPRRWCSVHNREEFKYESLEHELHAQPSTSAAIRAAAEEILHIWRDWLDENGYEKTVAILSRWFGKGETRGAGRVVNVTLHGEPTRTRLREIESSVADGYEAQYRELGWSAALQATLRDLHFLLTFFNTDTATPAAPSPGEPPDRLSRKEDQ